MENTFSYEPYQRQINLTGFGKEAQEKISKAKVLVIGVGGLGCPAIQYLVSMGIQFLGVVDHDIVSLSNLHRQILFSHDDIGKRKVDIVKEKYPQLHIDTYHFLLDQFNAFSIIEKYDIVVDCTDNFKSRYIINDICVLLKKPLVFGAVFQYEGQVAVLNANQDAVHYRDIFPISPSQHEAPSCAETGVYAITTGFIGMMQANEVIKWITGIGELLTNQLLTVDARSMKIYSIALQKNSDSKIEMPQTKEAIEAFSYDAFCGVQTILSDEISVEEFDQIVSNKNVQLVDIRNENELPDVSELNALRIPLLALKHEANQLDQSKHIVLFCHSGIRTQSALEILQDELHFKNVSHLKGGIIKWLDYKTKR